MSKVTVKPGVNLPSEAIIRLLRTAERLKVSLIVVPEDQEISDGQWEPENYNCGNTARWPDLVKDPDDD